jgi:oligopeptide transport system substrate-binding protein
MLKHVIALASIILVIVSCSNPDEDLANKKAVGGARYGGEFRFMSPEKVASLLPLQAVDLYSQRMTTQIFDQLLRLDPSGKNVIPSVAETYTVSPDGKTYTFKIRKGVYFHNDECFGGDGCELTAEDVKFTFDMACSGLKINEVSWLLVERIEGASAFNKATKTTFKEGGVSGIKAVDNHTLTIKLKQPFSGFDKILAYSGFGIFPREAYDTYGNDLINHPVGSGPFMLEEKSADKIVLKRNPNYWRKDEFGNQLPFLGRIIMTYSTNKKSELLAFRNQEIDLVMEIPAEEVENVLGSLAEAQAGKTVKHKVDSKPSFSMTFIGFAHKNPIFQDINVRKAFNLALDREELVNNELMGEGYAISNGMIPNSEFFDASKVKGYTPDVAKAKALLATAGYPDGKGFPMVTLYVNGTKDSDRHRLAKGVAKQLKEKLNVTIQVKLVSIEERNKVVSNGTAAMWVSGWIADYPDGESFMSLFYGGNIQDNAKFINPFKYKSTVFDGLYEAANKELDASKRHDLLIKCDQTIIDDAVVMPIISDDFITMINSRIRNFETNSLENLDFSSIFIKELK